MFVIACVTQVKLAVQPSESVRAGWSKIDDLDQPKRGIPKNNGVSTQPINLRGIWPSFMHLHKPDAPVFGERLQ